MSSSCDDAVNLNHGDIHFRVEGLVLAVGNSIGARAAITEVKGSLVSGPGALASETLLDLVDPGLERSHVLLQLREGALEDFAPAALVGEPRLDPAQGLRDRVVLLLESLESVINRIKVPEHVLSQLGEPEVPPVEPAVDLAELVVHLAEPAVDLGELASHTYSIQFSRGHMLTGKPYDVKNSAPGLGCRFDLIPAIWQDVRGGHAVREYSQIR